MAPTKEILTLCGNLLAKGGNLRKMAAILMTPALKLFGTFDAADADVKKEHSKIELDQLEHSEERRLLGLDNAGIAANKRHKPERTVMTITANQLKATTLSIADCSRIALSRRVPPPDFSPSTPSA